MANITPNPYGTAVALASAANGDLISCADNYTLVVTNTDSSSHSFTLPTSATYQGRAVADDTFVVAAGLTVPVRMTYSLYADGNGQCAITYTAVTGMKVGVFAG